MRRLLARLWLALWRWTTVQQEPVPDRCVVIAAPHTSNWDFPVTMAMAEVKQVPIRWLGKAQMFNPVLGPFFRWMGGISVERSSAQGLVGDLAAEFDRHERLALVVPAEGTRSPVEYWKSGFYRIAQQAGVPIVCAFVDRETRTGGFGPVITPSGDIVADMDRIRAFYADKTGLKPDRFLTPRLREEDAADLPG
ncbi:MAG: 1-acyl-sn-glycerol-3-phosphate acyltransferase [Microthrixaceae bacterium]